MRSVCQLDCNSMSFGAVEQVLSLYCTAPVSKFYEKKFESELPSVLSYFMELLRILFKN